MHRRQFVVFVFAALLVTMPMLLNAQQKLFSPAPAPPATPPWITLWPNGAPGALGKDASDIPAIEVFLPAKNLMRSAVVIFPGGGYLNLAMDKEGDQYARWLNDRGVAGIVLRYRLGPRYHHPIELGDAQRAIRYVRAHAAELGIDKDKVGVWGSSAGGHLASSTGTHFDAGNPAAVDPIDRESSRPDFMVLCYPVITMTEPYLHRGSELNLLGPNADPKLIALMSSEQQVTKDTPPAFFYHTTDDKSVPVQNSIMFYDALISHGVSAELHIYQHGPHGTGLAQGYPELRSWPNLLDHWLVANGWAQGN